MRTAMLSMDVERLRNKVFWSSSLVFFLVAAFFVAHVSLAYGETAAESARDIPVAYDVDVVVVGGSSAGVAAAVEAAAKGARVFVAAQRPYLGEDLCGTYRLWLEAGEEPDTPLAKAIFAEPPALMQVRPGLPFTYTADLQSAGVHKDTPTPSMLADGQWASAYTQSVQYDGDVTIVADLAERTRVGRIHVMAFQRDNDIELQSVAVFLSNDGQDWKEVATIENEELGQGDYLDSAICLTEPISDEARYVKVLARKTARVDRILLGEIVIEPEETHAETPRPRRVPPMPMQVKRVLDEALLDAGVEFLYGCFATDVLRDAEGNPAGIVMANRSGRQAVMAKVIIDATPRAAVGRMAGAAFQAYPPGTHTFKRIVVGGTAQEDAGIEARELPAPVQAGHGVQAATSVYDAVEYPLRIPMEDGAFASFAEAEQVARDKTWRPGQVAASENLFQAPPDPMKGRKTLSGDWPGAEEVDLDVFRPGGRQRLYVLGGCADVPRAAAERLLRPLTLMAVGKRIGRAAAVEANTQRSGENSPPLLGKSTSEGTDVRLPGTDGKATVAGEIREALGGVRPTQSGLPTVSAEARTIPILGEYDVVVVGGGTGGAPAGIGAARHGAKTLVVEYLHGLGGVGTLGLIGKYYCGYRGGFTAEIDKGLEEMGGINAGDGSWDIEAKMEWYRRELRKAGADIWFGTLGCGALVDGNRVTGVVVATPEGRGVVLAKVVIDATGNADIAAAAGAECIYTDGSHVAVQGTGMPPRKLGASYTNTDYTMTYDTDLVDMWRTFVMAKEKYSQAYDLGQLIDTRERRRIVGDFVISPLDIFNRRTYPDTVVLSKSNFDTHGFTVHPFFALKAPDKGQVSAYTPYRCLLPKGLEGILATGLGISAHRDAMPILRMQPDIQNQGYAAGVAASMAALGGTDTRGIDIKALQQRLVDIGNLPESALTDTDSYPIPHEDVADAVARLVNEYDGIGVVLAQPQDALPLLRAAYEAAGTEAHRLVYAHVLGMMGDAVGVATLMERVAAREWDEGWTFTGMGQFGASVSRLDSLIIALGRARDTRALGPILEKLEQLGPEHDFSHHRAVAVAIETLGCPEAARPLADLLMKPGMTGHAVTDIDDAKRRAILPDPNRARDLSLRELILARALYRCGDCEGTARNILVEYARDLRGHHARHASAVLKEHRP